MLTGDRLPRVPDVVNAVSTQTTITINWSFTVISESRNETFRVMYGTTPGNLVMATPVQSFSTTITSLQPGTVYYYQIHSTNTFATLPDIERSINTKDGSEFNNNSNSYSSCDLFE